MDMHFSRHYMTMLSREELIRLGYITAAVETKTIKTKPKTNKTR
jgi:hypothetical protein